MELRKEKEIEYYEKQAQKQIKINPSQLVDFEGFNPNNLDSFNFCHQLLKENCKDKIILDYGCGNGIHSAFLAELASKMIGIDLSENSLKIAKSRIEKINLSDKTEFLVMDCEKTNFENNIFDIIFDGGTFSSLDLSLVYPEIVRILKPEGALIGIETFGHNPLTNFKRKINKILGKRTGWAASHIFQDKDLKTAKEYFNKVEVYYFHLISWILIPFLKIPGFKFIFRVLETIEKKLLKINFLKKYSFKVVFIFSNPKKI